MKTTYVIKLNYDFLVYPLYNIILKVIEKVVVIIEIIFPIICF